MKKNQFKYRKMAAAIIVVSAIGCSIAWIGPSLSGGEKDKSKDAKTATVDAQNATSTTTVSDEAKLVQLLQNDGLIDQVKGFVIEKTQNKLYINGEEQAPNVADKYLQTISKDNIRVEVFPFMERLRLHPDAGFMELLLPTTFSSPCVDYKPKKPGC